MFKKIISMALCLIMVLSFAACSFKTGKNSGKSDTEKFDRYEKGFFTKDAYYNESAGIKFNRPTEGDYRFDSVKNVSDFSTPLSGTKVDALCRTEGNAVAFFSANVGYVKSMDDAVDEMLKEVNKGSISKYELEDMEGHEKGENITLANKEYRQIAIKTKQSGQDIKIDLYLRIIGKDLFVIEQANAQGFSKDIDLGKYMEELNDKEDLDKLKDDSKKYEEELDKEEEKAKNDPAADTSATYVKGTKTANDGYTNASAKIKYDLPKDVAVSKLSFGSEYCVGAKGNTCVMTIASEYIGKVNTMDEVIKGFNKGLETSAKSVKMISSDKHETLADQTWRYVENEMETKQGQNVVVKSYFRIIGDKAMVISIQYQPGNEKAFETVKSGFSKM